MKQRGLGHSRLALAYLVLCAPVARAEDMESDAVYLPAPSARSLSVRNPLGTVRVQGWDRPQIRIIAEKRAASGAVLERLKVRVDIEGAGEGAGEAHSAVDERGAGSSRVSITTGFYLSDQTFNPLPLQNAAIDLVIDAPRSVALAALTFGGDIDAKGFRAGAHLSSQGGQIRVADLSGPVDTRTLEGSQWLEAIRGSLLASGVVGDLELQDVTGKRVDASVYKGQVTAREVSADPGGLVRLRSTVGTVVFIGVPRPGVRYDLATRDGDVRLTLRPAPFTLAARAPRVKSGFALVSLSPPAADAGARLRDVRRASYEGGAGGAVLELASARGEVSLEPWTQSPSDWAGQAMTPSLFTE